MFTNAAVEDNGTIVTIEVPIKFKKKGNKRNIATYRSPEWSKPPTVAQKAIARAIHWEGLLRRGEVLSITDLAELVGRDRSYVGKTLNLALLAPDIVADLMKEEPRYKINLTKAMEELPLDWEAQRRMLVMAS